MFARDQMHLNVVMRCLLVSKIMYARDQMHLNVVMRFLLASKGNSMLACDQAGDVCS